MGKNEVLDNFLAHKGVFPPKKSDPKNQTASEFVSKFEKTPEKLLAKNLVSAGRMFASNHLS